MVATSMGKLGKVDLFLIDGGLIVDPITLSSEVIAEDSVADAIMEEPDRSEQARQVEIGKGRHIGRNQRQVHQKLKRVECHPDRQKWSPSKQEGHKDQYDNHKYHIGPKFC